MRYKHTGQETCIVLKARNHPLNLTEKIPGFFLDCDPKVGDNFIWNPFINNLQRLEPINLFPGDDPNKNKTSQLKRKVQQIRIAKRF